MRRKGGSWRPACASLPLSVHGQIRTMMRQVRLQTRRRQLLRQTRRQTRRSMIRSEALIGAPAISAVAAAPRLALAIPACAGVVDPATIPLRAAPTKSAPMVEALDFVDIMILLTRDETHDCDSLSETY